MPGDLPDRVRLPDGRAEPFEPERITRSLFAAAERVGPADAFLSQELTEGVLHFLAADTAGEETTPAAIADVVGKVVRELGHPALALAYEERSAAPVAVPVSSLATAPSNPEWLSPRHSPLAVTYLAAVERLTDFSLTRVYSRDLASAHREGLIRLTDLATPIELAGLVVVPTVDPRLALLDARGLAGEFVAFDGPEYELAAADGDPVEFAKKVERAALTTGLTVILNLNVSDPPRLAQGAGPLFGPDTPPERRRRQIAEELAAVAFTSDRIRVFWHASKVDEPRPAWRNAEFVFDRPKTPVILGPGLDRATPAVLTQVGLNLGRLLDQLGGPPVDPDVFLKKVGSLTRFAKTAGHVRQDFLRKHARPGVREAFLLDRARLVLVPMGLADVAPATSLAPLDFARDILRAIRHAAETDRPRVLPVRVDSPLGDWGDLALPAATLKQQLKTASALHGATGAGRAILTRRPQTVEEEDDLIRSAYESSVSRLEIRTNC